MTITSQTTRPPSRQAPVARGRFSAGARTGGTILLQPDLRTLRACQP